MLANDFVWGVALDALRSRIPVNNSPDRIEHEDGVVGDAFHQDAKTALRLLKLNYPRRELLCPLFRALFQRAVKLLQFTFRFRPSCHLTLAGLI